MRCHRENCYPFLCVADYIKTIFIILIKFLIQNHQTDTKVCHIKITGIKNLLNILKIIIILLAAFKLQ